MQQFRHPMLVEETHDERARAAFIASLRQFTMADLYPSCAGTIDKSLAPRLCGGQRQTAGEPGPCSRA